MSTQLAGLDETFDSGMVAPLARVMEHVVFLSRTHRLVRQIARAQSPHFCKIAKLTRRARGRCRIIHVDEGDVEIRTRLVQDKVVVVFATVAWSLGNNR